jgi:histidine ammonia-lyase
MQEDHVSLGWHAARKLRHSIDALRRVLAIELVTASRAMALRSPLVASPVGRAVGDAVLRVAGAPGSDRYLAPELAAANDLLAAGEVTRLVAEFVTLA